MKQNIFLLFCSVSFLSAHYSNHSHHFQFPPKPPQPHQQSPKKQEPPRSCNDPRFSTQTHLRCQDFEAFAQAAHLKKEEMKTSWPEWIWPLWKIRHDQAIKKARAIQDDVTYYETLLKGEGRPPHVQQELEEELDQRKLLLSAMGQIAQKEGLEELYNERHSLYNSLSSVAFPFAATGVAWYLYGMPVYSSLKAGFNNKLSDDRAINSEYSHWSTVNSAAMMTKKIVFPMALATGETKYWVATGISAVGVPLAYRVAVNSKAVTPSDKTDIILSPNAQVATGMLEFLTWGPLLYNICAHAYYMRQLKDQYPFKEKTEE